MTSESYSETKSETLKKLKVLEQQNIEQRILHFVNVVNERVRSKISNEPPLFDPRVDASRYVEFIDLFRGVYDRKLQRIVFSMARAKKWLNSKRAMIYARTLFAEFLIAIEEYTEILATWQEPELPNTRFNLIWMWRFDILFAVLKGYYLPHNPHASVKPLICPNTLKHKSMYKTKLISWGLQVEQTTTLDELASQSQIKCEIYMNKYLKSKEEYENTTFCSFLDLPSFCSNQLDEREAKESLPIIKEEHYVELQQRCDALKQMNILLQVEIDKLQNDYTCECNINLELNELYHQNLLIKKLLMESQIIIPHFNMVNPSSQTFLPPQIDNVDATPEFMSVDENELAEFTFN